MTDASTGLTDYLIAQKKVIDAELLKILQSIQPTKIAPNGFEGSTLHSVLLGGKRLRPILALATAEFFGADFKKVLRPACALELIHAGSLMLDDLPCMDNADYRRGEPTTHKLYGEATTILASASLWVASYELLAELDHTYSRDIIIKTSRAMGGRGLVQGQLLDLSAFNSTQDIQELEHCYKLKTGVLFALATGMGATIAGASSKDIKKMEAFGTDLGIAFQIRDDIIDATQTFEQTGKDTQLDEKNNKPTYVSLLGLNEAQKTLDSKIKSCLKTLDSYAKESYLHEITRSLQTV